MNYPPAPVGAAVHYVNPNGICRAAIVTEIGASGRRHLHVLHQRELGDRAGIEFDPKGGTVSWHTFEPSIEPGCRLAAEVAAEDD